MIGSRLKHIRESLDISQKTLAELLNVKPPVLSRYESNDVIPTMDILSIFVKSFNINLHWLLTGSGSMFLTDQPLSGECQQCKELLKTVEELKLEIQVVERTADRLESALIRIVKDSQQGSSQVG